MKDLEVVNFVATTRRWYDRGTREMQELRRLSGSFILKRPLCEQQTAFPVALIYLE